MRTIVLLGAIIAIMLSFSYAREEIKATKEYCPLAIGNFWEYEIEKDGEKHNGKMELVEKTETGKFLVKTTDMGSYINWIYKPPMQSMEKDIDF
ncbi:MAG: hypothetical protein ABIH42_11455 [Planctomycetota bacterium]